MVARRWKEEHIVPGVHAKEKGVTLEGGTRPRKRSTMCKNVPHRYRVKCRKITVREGRSEILRLVDIDNVPMAVNTRIATRMYKIDAL